MVSLTGNVQFLRVFLTLISSIHSLSPSHHGQRRRDDDKAFKLNGQQSEQHESWSQVNWSVIEWNSERRTVWGRDEAKLVAFPDWWLFSLFFSSSGSCFVKGISSLRVWVPREESLFCLLTSYSQFQVYILDVKWSWKKVNEGERERRIPPPARKMSFPSHLCNIPSSTFEWHGKGQDRQRRERERSGQGSGTANIDLTLDQEWKQSEMEWKGKQRYGDERLKPLQREKQRWRGRLVLRVSFVSTTNTHQFKPLHLFFPSTLTFPGQREGSFLQCFGP